MTILATSAASTSLLNPPEHSSKSFTDLGGEKHPAPSSARDILSDLRGYPLRPLDRAPQVPAVSEPAPGPVRSAALVRGSVVGSVRSPRRERPQTQPDLRRKVRVALWLAVAPPTPPCPSRCALLAAPAAFFFANAAANTAFASAGSSASPVGSPPSVAGGTESFADRSGVDCSGTVTSWMSRRIVSSLSAGGGPCHFIQQPRPHAG